MTRAGVSVSVLTDIHSIKIKGHNFPHSLIRTVTEYGICPICELNDDQSTPEIQHVLYKLSCLFKDLILVFEIIMCMERETNKEDTFFFFFFLPIDH